VMKRCREMFAVLRICVRALKGFGQSVMAVTGSTARYSCAQYDPDAFVLEILNTCRINSGLFGFGSRR
jgi:hypothetical protein